MDLQVGVRALLHQEADAPRLRAAQVVEDHTARGEPDGIFGVHHFHGGPVGRGDELRLAVRVEEPAALEEPRRAGVVLRGAGPEHAHVLLDLLVGDAGVVGGAALGGHSQLVEDVLGAGEVVEVLPAPQALGELHHDLPVGLGVAWAVHGLVDLDDAALGAGGGALVLLVQGRRQHDVRMLGALAEEEVQADEELQLAEGLSGELRVRQGDQRVEAEQQEALDLAGVDGVHDLLGALAHAGQLVVGAAPDGADVLPVLGVADVAVARQLVALVAVFAAALAVALARDGAVAAAGPADAARGQHHVDAAQHVVHALALVLDAPGVEQEAGLGLAPDAGRLLDGVHGQARDLAGPLRRAVLHRREGLFEPVGVGVHEVPVDELPLVEQVQDAVGEGRVRAGLQGQHQVRGAGQGRDAGVHDDEQGAAVAGAPDVVRGDGRALGHVGTGHPDDLRQLDVGPGVGGAVDAEGLLVARAGAHHAEAAVVVEVLRLQAQARELAGQVALLVGEGHARQHGHGVLAVGGLDALDLGRGAVHGLVPIHGYEAVLGALHGPGEAVRVVALEVALHALGAELPLVEGELLPGIEADDLVVLHLELDAALLAAEAAVGLHPLVGRGVGEPAPRRGQVQVGAELGAELILGEGKRAHGQAFRLVGSGMGSAYTGMVAKGSKAP